MPDLSVYVQVATIVSALAKALDTGLDSRPARTLDKSGNLGCAMSQGLIHRLPSRFTSKPVGRTQAWRDQKRLST